MTAPPPWPPRWFIILSSVVALTLGTVGFLHEMLSASPDLGVMAWAAWWFAAGMLGPGVASIMRR